MTCEEDASHACTIDLGILHCPKTCGYCAPFEYERMKRFGKPQTTLLPSVLYQTRLKEAECHGFATVVQSQNYNPVLTLLPALDGKKKGNWPQFLCFLLHPKNWIWMVITLTNVLGQVET